jgi:hypothetical protein
VDTLAADLQRTEPGNDADAIERARAALDAAWREAVKTAESRRADYAARARAFRELVALDWKLPEVLRTALADARRSATGSVTAAPAADIQVSEAQLGDAQAAFLDALVTIGGNWQGESRTRAKELIDAGAGLSEPVVSGVAAQLQTFDQRFPLPDGLPHHFDAAQLEPALRGVAGQYLAARDIARVIADDLDRHLSELLQSAPRPAAVLAELQRLTVAAKAELSAFVEDPGRGQDLIAALVTLQAARASAPAALTNLAAAGNQIVDLAPQRPSTAAMTVAFSSGVLPGAAPGSLAVITSQLAPFSGFLISNAARLRRAKSLQTAVLAGLAILSMFVDKNAAWDGTWPGLLSVFVAAIMIDVSLDALIARFRGTNLT